MSEFETAVGEIRKIVEDAEEAGDFQGRWGVFLTLGQWKTVLETVERETE